MNKQETEKIKSIINNYKSIHQELNSYEKRLENMSLGIEEKLEDEIFLVGSKIKKCIKKLEDERILERKFYSSLEKKYGPGELDINTLEYKSKESIKN
jgi:hypothetical protein